MGSVIIVEQEPARSWAGAAGASVFSLATVGAALFTGAALSIAAAEQPARLALGDGPMLLHWQLSFRGAAPIQGGLAILTCALGAWAWRRSDDLRWLLGALLMLANWPFTWLLIMPLNQALLSAGPEIAGALTRAQIEAWGGLHLYRVGLGAAATAFFVLALATGPRVGASRTS